MSEDLSLFGIGIPKENVTGKKHECYLDVLEHKADKTSIEELEKKEYDEMNTFEKAKLHNHRIKNKKRKGIITIGFLDSKENPFDVSFDGHNEGSGSPCKDEEEVKKCVEKIKAERSKDYNLMIVDERVKKSLKQDVIFNEYDNKKVKMTIDLGYGFAEGSDYYNQEPVEDWVVRFENYGCMGSAGNSAGKTPEEVVAKYKADMLKEGYKEENIEIVTSPRTPEKLAEMKEMISDRKAYFDKQERDNFKKNGEAQILEYSEKLKKLLKIKYGCEVTIKVLKK